MAGIQNILPGCWCQRTPAVTVKLLSVPLTTVTAGVTRKELKRLLEYSYKHVLDILGDVYILLHIHIYNVSLRYFIYVYVWTCRYATILRTLVFYTRHFRAWYICVGIPVRKIPILIYRNLYSYKKSVVSLSHSRFRQKLYMYIYTLLHSHSLFLLELGKKGKSANVGQIAVKSRIFNLWSIDSPKVQLQTFREGSKVQGIHYKVQNRTVPQFWA